MITKLSTTAAILALTGAAAFLPSAANAAIVFTDGDLLLGFRATGGQGAAIDYLVDIGNAASIFNSPSPINFSLGAIGTDLANLYGANWFMRTDLLWSVSGVQKVAGNGWLTNTMFATAYDNVDGPLGTNTTAPWPTSSATTQAPPAGKIKAMGDRFGQGGVAGGTLGTDPIESTNANNALLQPTGSPNSYASYQPGGINTTGATAYGYFQGGIEGNFASVGDIYSVVPIAGGGDGNFEGNFTISQDAQLTFTPAGVVPEPSVVASLVFGAGVLASLRRRRTTTQPN